MANNKIISLRKQAAGSMESAATDKLELFADSSTSKMSSIDQNGLVTQYGLDTIDQSNIIYVGKHGSNSNDGKTVGKAVLTIAYAISLAEAQVPGPANGFVIQVVDGAVYIESFTVSAYITVQAPGATIIGNLVVEGFGGLKGLLFQATSGNAVEKSGDDDTGRVEATMVIQTGSTGNGIVCSQGELILDVSIVQAINGYGVLNSSSGNLAGTINKLNVLGTGKGIVCTGSGSETSLRMSKFIGASATGIDIDAGDLYLFVGEFNVGTGGDVASGADAHIFAGSLYGATFTGSGGKYITEAGVVPDHASTHENGGGDEISVAGLSGLLADGQTPLSHASTHEDGGADELEISDLATSETGTAKVLNPDGSGGVQWGDLPVPTVIQDSEDAEDTTTSTTYVQAWRYSPTLEVAKYILWYSAEYTSDDSVSFAEMRLQIDDTTTVGEQRMEPETGGPTEWVTFAGVYFLNNGSAGTVNFDFDFRTEGDTAHMRRKRIVLLKVVE